MVLMVQVRYEEGSGGQNAERGEQGAAELAGRKGGREELGKVTDRQ